LIPESLVRGASPPESERFSALECPKEAAILVLSGSFWNSRKPQIFADVSVKFCNLIAMSFNNKPS